MKSQKVLIGVLSVVFFLSCLQGLSWAARQYQLAPFVCNTGGPFGLDVAPFAIYFTVFLALFFFGRVWWITKSRSQAYIWLLIITAGMSNIIERLSYGCVYDFLQFPGFPLFNVADVVLTGSVVFLLWQEIHHRREKIAS